MSEKYLLRDDAPLGDKVWAKIDEVVIHAARGQLSGRKIIHLEGPYGLGLKSIQEEDREVSEKLKSRDLSLRVSGVKSLVLIRSDFSLPVRDIAHFEQTGLSLNLQAAVEAAMVSAQKEDDLIFNGHADLGMEGLLTARGTQSLSLQAWDNAGKAADDIIGAVTRLDEAGYHGPYSLALSPKRFNLLYRRYQQGNMTELEHVQAIITDGLVKAPALSAGGVLLASGRQFATIVIGQDMMTGFLGPEGGDYRFSISESLVLRLLQPEAVCVLKEKA